RQQLLPIVEALAPIGQVRLEDLASKPTPLPDREIRILEPQRRRGWRATGSELRIEHLDLPRHDAQGPAVDYDVVQVDQEHVLFLADKQQFGSEERPAGEVKRVARLGNQPLLDSRLAIRFPQGTKIEDRQLPRAGCRDDLDGAPADGREGGAQRLMARDHFAQAALEGRPVEPAAHPESPEEAVRRT